MSSYRLIALIHILSATIWVGGHMILSLIFLPKALKEKDPGIIRGFEARFEPLALPSLLVQIVTGLWLGIYYDSDPFGWFSFRGELAVFLALKVILVGLTLLLAVHARFRLIPRLRPDNMWPVAAHIIAVTLIGIMLLVLGVGIRTGAGF